MRLKAAVPLVPFLVPVGIPLGQTKGPHLVHTRTRGMHGSAIDRRMVPAAVLLVAGVRLGEVATAPKILNSPVAHLPSCVAIVFVVQLSPWQQSRTRCLFFESGLLILHLSAGQFSTTCASLIE